MSRRSQVVFLCGFWGGFFLAGPVFAGKLESIYRNNVAISELSDKKVFMAQKELLQSLREDPDNQMARLNLGMTFVLTKDLDKALKEFQIINERPNISKELKFLARYNTGRTLQEMKNRGEALRAYQSALEIDPDSLEVKANIELLLSDASGQGEGSGGQGEPEDQKDEGDQGESQDPKEQKDPSQSSDQQDNKEEPQSPQNLTEKAIQELLEELKNQEQKIRAMEYGNQAKEAQGGKTW